MNKKILEEPQSNALISAIEEIKKNHALDTLSSKKIIESEKSNDIVDIITFCDSPLYLDLLNPENGLDLYVSQRVILKCFYIGTIGNENIKLSQKEWEWLYAQGKNEERDGIEYKKNIDQVINKMHKRDSDPNMPYFKELHLVLGRRSGKCHEENQIISTTEGSITFKELNDRLQKGEKIGICTYDQNSWKRSVTYDIKSEVNGIVDCFTVETIRGTKETTSWNHPYLIWRNEWEKPRFVKISEIVPGDRIAVAKKTELFGRGGIGVNRASLLGHFQGDGGTTHSVMYTTSCPTMLSDFTNLINMEFPEYEVRYKSQYDYSVVKKTRKFAQNGSQKNLVKEWLKKENCWGKKSKVKEVPDCIFKGSKSEVAAFLSRLYGCDGWASTSCVQKSHKIPRSQIGFCSSSEKFIYGVKHLLLKFGIHTTINKKIAKCNGKNFDAWTLSISRQECIETFEKEINIFSKENRVKEIVKIEKTKTNSNSEFDGIPMGIWQYIEKIMAENNLSGSDVVGKHGIGHNERLRTQYSPNKNKIISYGETTNDDFLKAIGSSDLKWDEVKSIMPVGKKNTIALEVAGTNVIGSDLISHNTLLASIISVYEAYKLLVINGGDPHKYYKLPADDEIAIINVALSEKQAGRLFGHIQSRLRNAPFFKGRIAKETASEIKLYTDKDLDKKKKGSNISVPGSVLLLCGHSNPDSLAGYNAILLLFDEIAFYDETGKVTGKYFYTRLKPSLSRFFKSNAAHIVQISSPNTRIGVFYETSQLASTDDDTGNSILSFQLPTWDVNPDVPYDEPELIRDRKSNLEMFTIEYGAQWAEGGSYHNYFPEELVNRCIRGDLAPHDRPMPGVNYYIHVDPAKGGNNYAAVMVAKQRYTNNRGHKRVRCILAGVWIWRPVPGMGLQFAEIDKDIIKICSIFHPMAVTYDDYHSMQSMQLLRSHGINTQIISFNRSVKAKLYQNLRDLMAYQPESELYLFDNGGESSLLISELRNLRLKQTQRGYTILPDKNADVKSDDIADCLAGACVSANEGLRMALPEPVTVRTGWL